MVHVELDAYWPEHPKVIRAGLEGAGLHAIVLCLAAKSAHGTIPRDDLREYGATDELIDCLVELRLIHDAGNDEVTPHSVYIGGLARPCNSRRGNRV